MRRRTGMSNLTAGVIALVVVTVACYFGFTKRNPFAERFTLHAAFTESTHLRKGAPVRVAGVEIGRVRDMRAAPGSGRATLVTMEIEDNGLPLHRDATFKARPRMFLEGNDFLDVHPGSPSAPELEDGDTIPASQTAAPVGLRDVLEIFKRDGREDLRRVLDEYGRALDGGGAAGYNRSIRWWEGAYRDGAVVSEATLGQQRGDLRRYLDSSAKVAAALDRNPEVLKSFITDFATTASALASEHRALAEAIGELPGMLRTGRRALGSLNQAFPPLRRFVAEMRPAVRSSGPALDAQLPFVRQLRGLVRPQELRGLARDLRRTVPDLVHLTEGGVELQTQARLLASCQVEVIGPWQRDRVDGPFPSAGLVYQEGVKWLPGIAAESRSFDANGQYVKSQANGANYVTPFGDGQFLLTGSPLKGVVPGKAPQPGFDPGTPCETQERPDLRAHIEAPPKSFPVDLDSPAARKRRERAMRRAVPFLRDSLKQVGLDDELEVTTKWLKRSQLDDVRRTLERGR